MYSTLPSVIGELVANCWDANATEVQIEIPEGPIDQAASEITITDNGIGMSDQDIREKYLIAGRDRRENENTDKTPKPFKRRVMGRKGIGKLSAFGIAREIEVESVKNDRASRFIMNYEEMLKKAKEREIKFPALSPSGTVSIGTKITLRSVTKFHNRSIPIGPLRRRLARRFSIIGAANNFSVKINQEPISAVDRDLKRLLERDTDGEKYLWEYDNVEISPGTGWRVSGWIGALNRTTSELDDVDRGIALMARGKIVQEPFVFQASVGQQYALSYLVGELNVEFVDDLEDTIGTSRNSLVWETEANAALLKWGQQQVNSVAREWARKRSEDNATKLNENALYLQFRREAEQLGKGRALTLADRLVRQAIDQNPADDIEALEPIIQTSLDFLRFDAFWEIVSDLAQAEIGDIGKTIELFREWQIVEAKEMSRITEGRISTVTKFQNHVEQDAMEVPTLHNFLKEFPWVIDPRWTLIADEVYYSRLLKEKFPESDTVPESDRRIDFLCVGDSNDLYLVEIKRPSLRASRKHLEQIEDYVIFLKGEVAASTDPEFAYSNVIGYLVCGDMVTTSEVEAKREMLANSRIYVRLYRDMLSQVQRMHQKFLKKYEELQEASQNPA